MEYEDFVIQIGPDRGNGHPVQVLKSPAGEGVGAFHLPFAIDQVESVLGGEGRLVRGASAAGRDLRPRLSEPAARLSAQQMGDQLFRALFSGQVRSLYDTSLGMIGARRGCGLRIKLKLDARERDLGPLISIPWELLWRIDTEDFLSLSRLSPLVRYLDVPRQAVPIRVGKKLRILVVTSSPHDLAPLDLERERLALETACKGWKGVEVVFLDRADPALLRGVLLEKDFHVLHFMGHGGFDKGTGEGVLHFQGAAGQPESVTGQALATFLKDFRSLGLVFLNACDTARAQAEGRNPFSGVAGALVLGGLPAVVAMQFPISDQAAIAFSAAFYQRLAGGDPVDAAVVEGRQAVFSASPQSLEWATPVLFLRIADAAVFRVVGADGAKRSGDEAAGGLWPASWRRGAAVLLLPLFLGGGAAFSVYLAKGLPSSARTFATGYLVNVDRQFSSTVAGVAGTLTRAEILPNGRMRLHFQIRNQSGKEQAVGFDYRSTYLADPAGNRYGVLATDVPGESTVSRIPPKGEVDRWLEFPAPLDQAKAFQVGLAGPAGGGIQFPFFGIELSRYPPALSVPTKAPPPEPGAAVLAMKGSFKTSVPGLTSNLRGVELLKDGRMRWRFAFYNGSGREQAVGFDYSGIYLQDQLGNRYPLISSDTGGGPGQTYRESLQRALRTDHWFEFAAPYQGARTFTVVLASQGGKGLSFLPFHVEMPYYPPEYARPSIPKTPQKRPDPPKPAPKVTPPAPVTSRIEEPPPAAKPPPEPARSVVAAGSEGFDSNVQGVTGTLSKVERLDDGRLRWSFEFLNQSGRAVDLGFNEDETYLSDNLGHRYRVVRSDQGNGSGIHHAALAPGARVTHWFEFPPPTRGADRFMVSLCSSSPQELGFPPFQAKLPR